MYTYERVLVAFLGLGKFNTVGYNFFSVCSFGCLGMADYSTSSNLIYGVIALIIVLM